MPTDLPWKKGDAKTSLRDLEIEFLKEKLCGFSVEGHYCLGYFDGQSRSERSFGNISGVKLHVIRSHRVIQKGKTTKYFPRMVCNFSFSVLKYEVLYFLL